MRKTVNISVSEQMHEFIMKRTRNRFYSSVSEYIRTLVREDERRQMKVESIPFKMPRTANEVMLDPANDLDL